MKTKKHLFKKILLGIVVLILLAIVILLVINQACYLHERQEHEKAGYYHGVDIGGGQKINVVELGSENGMHTIVGLAGMGVSDYCVYMNRVNQVIGADNTLVYVDRAGNGYSDDTCKTQTVSQVVEDYRNALQKAGYSAPYLLMPFSLGGLYATYWESTYPDEIEGVVYIDCSSFTGDIDTRGEGSIYTIDEYTKPEIFAAMAESRLGLQRFLPYEGFQIGISTLTEEELRLTFMAENRGYTFAFLSQVLHEYDLLHEVRDACVKNDIPKIYISTVYTCADDLREYFAYMNQEMEAAGETPMFSPDNAESAWKTVQSAAEEEMHTLVLPFVEAVGNCELISIGGDHWIFLQKPDEVSQTIMAFLEKLNQEQKTDQ